MKFGKKICPNDNLGEFDNVSGWLKNMAAIGLGILP
jgi:hypothetical protein